MGAGVAQPGGEPAARRRREIAHLAEPERVQAGLELRSDAPQPGHRERGEEGPGLLRPDLRWPFGLARSEAIFATNLHEAMPAEAGRPTSAAISRAEPAGDLGRWPEERLRGGHVQERLVERERLDERRVAFEDGEHLLAGLGVGREARRHHDRLGRQPQRPRHRHGAPDAEGAHLVARGQHHAALRVAADDDRPAAQLGPVALLDGRVEGVHVHVEDGAHAALAPRRHATPPDPPTVGAVRCPAARR